MKPTLSKAQQSLLLARTVAERIEQEDLRQIMLDGLDTAILMQDASRAVEEAKKLVALWRRMPEHVTGAQAIRELDSVLNGGYAPTIMGQRPKGNLS